MIIQSVQRTLDTMRFLFFTYKPYLVPKKKRGIPDFLIIGAQKCGTTTLRYTLEQHPDIFIAKSPITNELHFFSREDRWDRGAAWYTGHFYRKYCLQGEKCPEYLFLSKCHERMSQIIPNAKLLILLRNPTDRAYSQWNHYNQMYHRTKRWGWEIKPFEDALETRPELLERGHYVDQLLHLNKYFDRKSTHITITENLRKDPLGELQKICGFLEVDHRQLCLKNRHVRSYPAPMSDATRQRLFDYFKPYNEQLFEYLGFEIPEWRV